MIRYRSFGPMCQVALLRPLGMSAINELFSVEPAPHGIIVMRFRKPAPSIAPITKRHYNGRAWRVGFLADGRFLATAFRTS